MKRDTAFAVIYSLRISRRNQEREGWTIAIVFDARAWKRPKEHYEWNRDETPNGTSNPTRDFTSVGVNVHYLT